MSDEERRTRGVRIDYKVLSEGRGSWKGGHSGYERSPFGGSERSLITEVEQGARQIQNGGRLEGEATDGVEKEDEIDLTGFQVESGRVREQLEADRLRIQLKELEEEELRLREQRELASLRRRVDDKKRSVSRLRGEVVASSKSKDKDKASALKSIDFSKLTIQDLRQNKDLRAKAKSVMFESGLGMMCTDSDDDSDPSERSDSESHVRKRSVKDRTSLTDSDSKADAGSRSASKKKAKKRSKKRSKDNAAFSVPDSDDNLNKKKKKKKRKSKAHVSSGSSSDSSSDSDSQSTEKKKKRRNKSRRKVGTSSSSDSSSDCKSKKKSGILSKSSDRVKYVQKYPQAFLRFEHVSSKISFEKLDFNLFVAGELEIISDSSIKSTEKKARLEFLKRLMYLSSSHDFVAIKSLYAAVLREIEIGKKVWGDDFSSVETGTLNPGGSKRTFVAGKRNVAPAGKPRSEEVDKQAQEKAWFCSLYQRNKCEHKMAHAITVKGRMRWAQHICATCYQKNQVKLAHPECASDCPHFVHKP